MRIYVFLLGALGVWRVTHLLQAENGPGDVLSRMRERLRTGWLRGLADCFYCLSAWVAIPFALAAATLEEAKWLEATLLWPALSAAAILVERLAAGQDSVDVTYQEDPGEDRKEP